MRTRTVITAILLALFVSGCGISGDTLSLGEYKGGVYSNKQSIKSVQLGTFSDDRDEKPLVATVVGVDGKKSKSIFIKDDVGVWLSNALNRELSLSTTGDSTDTLIVTASIKDLYVLYTANPAKTKNLALSMKVDMTIAFKDKTFTRTYFVKREDYRAFISSSEELAPFIKSNLSELAQMMSKDIIKYSSKN